MIDVVAIVRDLARRRGLDPGDVSVIELNRSSPARGAVALLAFRRGAPQPLAFLKATDDPRRASALRREFDNLSRLAQDGSPPFRRTVPEPLWCERIGASTVLAEAARAGTRMKDFPPDDYFASGRFRDHYLRCAGWLAELRRTLAARGAPAPPARLAADEVARYRSTHRASPVLDALFDDAVAALARVSLPGVPSHGDFCTANVIVGEDDDPFVIDWEHPLTPTWPLADLLYFTCSTWCVPYRKGAAALEDNYRRLFFERHAFGDLIRDAVAREAAELGLASDLLLPLSALVWAGFANRKDDDLSRGGRSASGHLPLILVDHDTCLNLEILAERRERYLR